jgi:hypothetical protein
LSIERCDIASTIEHHRRSLDMTPSRLALALCAACLSLPALAQSDRAVVGQKLDSGLGSLPHYSKWLDQSGRNPLGSRVAGESLDNGLGELPHYSKWLDRNGRDPLGRDQAKLAGAAAR